MDLSNAFTISSTRSLTSLHQSKSTSLYETSPSFQDDFIDKQRNINESNTKNDEVTTQSIEKHLKHQQQTFNDMSEFFNSDEAIPPEIEPILTFLVKKALGEMKDGQTPHAHNNKKFSVLDIGTGTGALFPYYLKVAEELDLELNIVGVDLSPKMLDFARENAKHLISNYDDGKHSIRCENGDFVKTVMGQDITKSSLIGFESGIIDEHTQQYREGFDAVVINACFGNFLDQDSVITAAATSLKNDGVFVISHPLGADFVAKLGEESPEMVPHRLPNEEDFDNSLAFQPLNMISFVDDVQIDGDDESKSVYYASAKKLPYRMLRDFMRLRGPVDQGYGRGGKKLGFPTANLPSSLFADALADVPTGVYIGWAVIESSVDGDKKKGRDMIHKAVVNVGYSPTFDGEENKEKIVEAHLIIEEGDIEGDFYGETMRLGLYGFLRPEMKFPSFPDLIKAITNDVSNAKNSLGMRPFVSIKEIDLFVSDLSGEGNWVGTSGGDEIASYEFDDTMIF